MCSSLESERQRQLRRCGNEGRRDQKNRGTDQAIAIVSSGILRRRVLGWLCDDKPMCRAKRAMRATDYTVDVSVAERDNDLQQERRKREICAAPAMAANPSHATMLMLRRCNNQAR
jgi:hypothetical protein